MIEIQQKDFVPLVTVAFIFYWVGKRAVIHQATVRTWAVRFAMLSFIGTTIVGVLNKPNYSSEVLLGSTATGLLIGFLVLGPSYIAFGILHAIWRQVSAVMRAIERGHAEQQRQNFPWRKATSF